MAWTQAWGIGIAYDVIGRASDPAVAITPGGRFSMDSPGIGDLADALVAGGRRVLLWDRPNCGASDMCFDGESEAALHADVLIDLVEQLGLGPIALAGGSAGSRVAMLAAAKRPDMVSHLALWWISGGLLSMMSLGAAYCCDAALTASMKGMEGVAGMPLFAEQLRRNPRNRDYLLHWEPQAFIRQMETWARPFAGAGGLTAADSARLTMPVLVFGNSAADLYHPAVASDAVLASLPHARRADAPWPDDAFARRFMAAIADGSGTGHFRDWPLLAPQLLSFLQDEVIR